MNEWTVQSIKGFIAEHKNSGGSYYETKAKDIECLLNEYNGLIDRALVIIDEENNLSKLVKETPLGCGLNDTLAKNIKNRVLALKGGEQK